MVSASMRSVSQGFLSGPHPGRMHQLCLHLAQTTLKPLAGPELAPLAGPNPRITRDRLGAKSVLPARMPHADALKAHIAQGYGWYSSHGIPGRARGSVTVSDGDRPGRSARTESGWMVSKR